MGILPARKSMVRGTVLCAACLLVFAAGLLAVPAADAHTPLRGLIEPSILSMAPADRERTLDEMAQLHVQITRLFVLWSQAEPAEGQYDTAVLDTVRAAATEAAARKIAVVVTVYATPEWASDRAFWGSPPLPRYGKGYQDFYPIAKDKLQAFQDFCTYLATSLKGTVGWYECWNEPNLWLYLYPQKTAADPRFGARTYVSMLRRFWLGVKAGDPTAKVIGGATSPIGKDTVKWTSPLTFARSIAWFNGQRYFDAYAHHPYPIGGTRVIPPPEQVPRDPQYHIALANLGSLLRIFPSKPFYLDEYGYLSQSSYEFGGGGVGLAKQADYLTRAYKYVRRYLQVKALFWYQIQDRPSWNDDPWNGLYFGLRDIHGKKKPSWNAYFRLPVTMAGSHVHVRR